MDEHGSTGPRIRDIDLPLGMTLNTRTKAPAKRFLPSKTTLFNTLLALVIVASAGLIAMRERPFRVPEVAVVSVPAEVAEETAPAAEAPPASTGGPSIVRVGSPTTPPPSVTIIRDPNGAGQDPRVAHLPDRALIENTDDGPLPKRADDGRRPFDTYARPWSGARGARIALVIGGLGVSQSGTQEAIAKLPPEVTLAFASGGNSLSRWMQAARQAGHELVLQVPLEPFDYPSVDPGKGTLTVDAAPAENIANLHSVLGRMTNYVGLVNYMGARFVADAEALKPMMAELSQRGLMYLDDGSSARSETDAVSQAHGVPFAAVDTQIDGTRERGEILKKLDELERTARAQGQAVGIGSAFDTTVEAVASWVAEAKKRGIEIVPISAVARDPERR